MATATDRQEVTSARGEGPLVWPRIASSHTVSFPLTLIGNYTEMKLLLRNPSPHPLYIRPLLLSSSGQYDSSHKLLPLLSEIYKLKPFASNFSKNSFSILRPEPIKGPVLDPLDLILPPRGTGTLTIRYNPIQEYNNNNNDNDVLLLKNNLTVLDPVVLKGSSSRGFITIDGVHPSNGNQGGALLFEFSQSMLEGYINGMECGMSTTDLLTHWKLFHVRNSGPAPITINRISIGPNGGCQGNGFKVSNCRKQFIIYPNKTRNIEISCSPDFTVSRISSSLVLHSSKGSQIEFLLSALLPHHMLSLCYMATPPSDLEYMTAYLSVPLWILALLIMIIVTVLQVKWHTSKLLQPVVARETLVVKDVPIQPTGGKLFSFSDIKKLTSNISLPIATPTQHQSVKGPIENVISFSTSSSVSSLSISSTISPVTLSPLSTATSSTLPSSTVPSSSVPSSSVPSSSVLSVHYSSKQDQSVTDYETGMRHQTTTAAAVTCADKPDRTSSTNSRPHPPEPNVKKVKPIQRKSSRSVTSERGVAPLDDKADELLVRKESDESLPNSDDTSSGGSVSGSVGGASEDFSPVEEHPGAKKKNKPHPQLPKPQSSKPHPSYTKEPLTGQTIEVKEEPQTDEDLTTPTTELTTPPHLIKAVKSKKKQKQLKKEDKLTRRRQREPPTVTNNSNTIVTNNSNSVSSNSSSIVTNNSNGTGLRSKRFHGSQESLDKESVASNSTNSTDNNDEEQTPPTQEEAVPSQVETKELEQLHNDPIATDARGGSVPEEPMPVKDIDPPPPLDPVLEVEPIPKESSPKPRPQKLELSQEGGAEDIKSAESGPSSVETDGTMRGEREGGAVNNNNEKQQRKDPHQLAASLLQTNKEKIIVRRVVSNEEGGEKGSKRTEAVVTSPSKDRKKHSTGGEEKRYNPSPSSLSHDATPFYPGFNPHHHQFPHHIPLGRPHLPQPRPPPPHHIPPPYDYPPPPGPHMHYHPISEEGPYPPPDSRHYESVMNRKHVKHSKQFHLPLPTGGTPPGVTPPPPYYGPGPYREMTPPHIYDERMRPHPPLDHYYDVDYYHGMKHRSEMGRGPPGAPPPGWRPKRTSFESPPISHLKPGPDEYEHAHVSAYEEQPLMRSSSRFHGYHHMENIDPTPHHDSYSISRLREGGVVPSYPVHHDDMKLLANKRLTDGGVAKMGGSNSGTSLSLLLSQSSSSGWSSSLNRAPGTIPSNNQYSKIPSTQYGGERNWMIDENEKDVLTRFSPDSSDTSTCQRLWSLNSPLSNALEEQRLQTATQLAAAPSPSPPPPLFPPSGDNYDPFDNSLSSIWSFGNRGNANRGGTLLWDTESDD